LLGGRSRTVLGLKAAPKVVKHNDCGCVAGLAGKGDFNELMAYSGQAGYKPDYLYLMQRLMMDNPEAAVNLAKMIAKQPGPPMDLNTLADLFLQRNAVREATAFLLDVLQENKPEHDKLQTKVSHAPSHWLCKLCVDFLKLPLLMQAVRSTWAQYVPFS